jgi:DNA-binding transcriptional LysR family regulator
MEIRQLEYLVAVIEEANFTRAAERVRVSQSGISAQIRQLERELGQELVDRSGRTVRATDAGRAMLPYARAALGAVSGAQFAVDEISGLTRGRVAIGMVTACSIPVLFELLARFHDAYPGVDISLTEDNSDALRKGVLDGRFDLAFVGAVGATPAGLESLTVIDEELVAAVSLDHALSSLTVLDVAALDGLPLITMPVGTGIRAAFDAACTQVAISPRIVFEASTADAVGRLARHGVGVAIMSESMAESDSLLHTVRLESPRSRSRLDFVWRSGSPSSPASRALIALAQTL